MNAPVERALLPVDQLRQALIRALVGWLPARRLLARRAERVPLLLGVHAAVAFALALFAPALPLLLSPLVFGVPHIAADVRYLVVRRAVPTFVRRAVWPLALALLAVRIAAEAHVLHAAPMRVEHALGAGWVLLGALAGSAQPDARRYAPAIVAAALALAVFALGWPGPFRLVLAHGHNLVAIAIWLALFRREQRVPWRLIALLLGGAGVLASGVVLDTTLRHGALSALGLHLFAAADWLAPGVPDRQGVALTVSFAYLQTLHYAIWLIAIPQQDGRAEGPTTWRMAWRSLVRDLGRGGVALCAALAAVVLVCGAFAPVITRNLFLSLATFHAWLELSLLAFLLSQPRAPGRGRAIRAR